MSACRPELTVVLTARVGLLSAAPLNPELTLCALCSRWRTAKADVQERRGQQRRQAPAALMPVLSLLQQRSGHSFRRELNSTNIRMNTLRGLL